ncbi:MAG TPA: hypothetical protein VKE94_22900, partial [Gemmataceae bacterium]|nr:hypothetical protein [Gemmataceae bacterium]
MNKLRSLAVVAVLCTPGLMVADDGLPIPRGSLGSGASLGQSLGDLGIPGSVGSSPFSNGLGQIVSGWARQGIHGPELAERIHWLQSMRSDEIAERTRGLGQGRFGRDDDFRDWGRNRDIR